MEYGYVKCTNPSKLLSLRAQWLFIHYPSHPGHLTVVTLTRQVLY